MKLSFHGADRGVTGSCHLVECGGRRVLVDCGLFQGSRALNDENAAPFGFDARAIDLVLLTHAHLDHCGRLPLLVARGFAGEIVTTAASRELAQLVMLDTAHLLEQEMNHHGARDDRSPSAPAPLYTVDDVSATMARFGRAAAYGAPIDLVPGIRATFVDAGHILGSASVLLELEEDGHRQRVLCSGDLGSPGRPLMRDPAPPPAADVVVMESTYGDRDHRGLEASVAELYGAIVETFHRGGDVVIPTFALERAQELLYWLREGIVRGRLPNPTPIFLDSPMAISATEIFRRHPECLDADAVALFAAGHDPLHPPGLQLTRETSQSKAINAFTRGAIILAGSGMCTGGRVRHHLQRHLPREASSIVFVGYAARGTPARAIIDGAKSIRLFGEDVPVRARIHTINGFSAHAGRDQLLAWRTGTRAPRTLLVHGEEPSMLALASRVHDSQVEMPALGDEIAL